MNLQRTGQRVLLCGALAAQVGCAGSQQAPKHAHDDGSDLEDEEEPSEAPEPPAMDVVQKAARPFTGYRPVDDKKLDPESLLTHLAAADAICIGERHDKVLDHYAQLRVLEGLAERRPLRGFELGLALEMVRSKEQPTLGAYGESRIGVEEFEDLSGWKDEWGFPIQYYAPQMDFARRSEVPMIGLGVDRETTSKVARVGFDGLDEAEQSQLPELERDSAAHRALFDSMMAGHPMEVGASDKYYDAQLIWDEAMAELSAGWLKERAPGRKLVIFAGSAHCHRTAIPSRIQRRTGFEVVSLLPVEDAAKSVAQEPSSAEEHLVAGYDYQMVFTH